MFPTTDGSSGGDFGSDASVTDGSITAAGTGGDGGLYGGGFSMGGEGCGELDGAFE